MKFAALALVLHSSSPVFSQSQEVIKEDPVKNKLEDTRTAQTTLEKNSDKTFNLDADWRFTTKDENGNEEFNLGGLIAPFGVEGKWETTTQEKIKAEIPLMFAHDFRKESTGFTNKNDSVKMREYIKNKLLQVFANNLYRIGETKGVYRTHHEGKDDLLKNQFSKTKITSIKITGYASPEASSAKSVIPGNKEKENEDLAKSRAEIVREVIREVLEENKIDSSVLDSINFEEVQFSNAEMDQLTGIADSLGIKGAAMEDQILELVSRYNAGEYNDNPSVKKIMDEVVGSKRSATVEIEFETKEKTQVVVPIPLLLLLLLSRKIRRGLNPFNWKKKRGEEDKEPKPEKPKKLREIFSEKDIDEEKVAEGKFNYYQLYEGADKEVSGRDKYIIIKHFIEEELYPHIDDEASIQHGLDYRSLIEHIATIRERYNTEEEVKTEIARELLSMWEQYDREVRREAGVDNVNEKTTLDYRHDEKKILWAKLAAPEILHLAENNTNPEDMLNELQKMIKKLEDNENLGTEKEEITGPWNKKDGGESIPNKKPGAVIDTTAEPVPEEDKTPVNEIDPFEYKNSQSDLKMLNKLIRESVGITSLGKLDFASEYGRKRYDELKSIGEGDKPITFNKEELQIIGDEMERYLSSANKIPFDEEEEKTYLGEREIFREFEDFVATNPDAKIPKDLEDRYRRAEEKLKMVHKEIAQRKVFQEKENIGKAEDFLKQGTEFESEYYRYKVLDLNSVGNPKVEKTDKETGKKENVTITYKKLKEDLEWNALSGADIKITKIGEKDLSGIIKINKLKEENLKLRINLIEAEKEAKNSSKPENEQKVIDLEKEIKANENEQLKLTA